MATNHVKFSQKHTSEKAFDGTRCLRHSTIVSRTEEHKSIRSSHKSSTLFGMDQHTKNAHDNSSTSKKVMETCHSSLVMSSESELCVNSMISRVKSEGTAYEDCFKEDLVPTCWSSITSSSADFNSSVSQLSCSFCDSLFPTSMSLTNHCLDVHVYPKLRKCNGCSDDLIRIVMQHECNHRIVEPDQNSDTDIDDSTRDGGVTCPDTEEFESPKLADLSLEVKKKRRVRPKIGLNEYKCWHCESVFSTLPRLREHRIETHSHEKRYKCSVCDKAYKRPDGLEIHMRNHTGERPYACHECSKTFSMSSSLKAHLITHNSGKMFLCKDCGKSFASSHTLRLHSRLHTGERPFKCPLCEKAFARSDAMKSHLRIHRSDCGHSPVAHLMEKLLLPGTSKIDEVRRDLDEEHNKTEDTQQMEPPALDFSLVFTKRFMCSECGKQFFSHSMLVRHLRTHTGEKPFTCTECSASFADQGNLKRHKRLHTGEKPYKCDECSRQFSMPHSLKVHHLSHKRKKHLENQLLT